VSSPLDAIRRVVDAFERSDWSEIDVRWGDVRVHLAVGPAVGTPTSSPTRSRSDRSTAPPPDVDRAAIVDGRGDAVLADAESVPPPAGAHLVVAPSPGIFWRSPEPGAPPFADVGDTVDTSSTVCIIEVMKLMNHVKAGVRGDVVAVYGENGVAVDKGAPLFAIAPTESSP
jgi:acetyl-CoA carboxylase biotin carboxyl carrier protein